MIITEKVNIEINKGNIPYYKKFEEFQNIKIGDKIDVNIKFLSKSNPVKIKYKCDSCGKEFETSYKSYCDPRRNNDADVCKGKCANEKRENTNINLFGVKNCFQSEDKKNIIKQTMIKKYGVDHNMKTEKCLNQRKETYMKNWGVDNPSQSDEIKIKKENTCLKNFGVKSPLQNRNVFMKSKLSSNQIHKYKEYDNLTYQGSYEYDFLNKYSDIIKIENPNFVIQYEYEKLQHKYHPDFFIDKYNLIIEIKSEYTYNKEIDKNLAKKKFCIDQGYEFLFIINKKYDILDNILQNAD